MKKKVVILDKILTIHINTNYYISHNITNIFIVTSYEQYSQGVQLHTLHTREHAYENNIIYKQTHTHINMFFFNTLIVLVFSVQYLKTITEYQS